MSKESKILAEQEIVVDKMHMKGHVDMWCKHCDPAKYPDLNAVSLLLFVLYCIVLNWQLLLGRYRDLPTHLFLVIQVQPNNSKHESAHVYVFPVIPM